MTCEINVSASTMHDWMIEFIDDRLNLFNLIFQSRTDEGRTDVNECMSWSSPSSYTRWHPSLLHWCAIEKINLNKFNRSSINSIVQSRTVEAQTFNSHIIIKYSILIGLKEAKTILILCACTFGVGRIRRIGRISDSFPRKTLYLYKQSTIWAQTAQASCWILYRWLRIVMKIID